MSTVEMKFPMKPKTILHLSPRITKFVKIFKKQISISKIMGASKYPKERSAYHNQKWKIIKNSDRYGPEETSQKLQHTTNNPRSIGKKY